MSGCAPAANVLSRSSVSCDECPFPFCVVAEAKIIRLELREHLVRIMSKLGSSVEEIAETMGVSKRSVYRYAGACEYMHCVQCDLAHSQDVMCRSNTYTVVYSGGQYTIVLNSHRHATVQESELIGYFIDYAFPSSTVERVTSDHEYWVLGRVELEEAKNFQTMCDALNRYTLSLSWSKGKKCLQTVPVH